MAQIETGLYKSIADAYSTIDASLASVKDDARVALDAIVDVTTTSYPDPSANADAALEIELELLSPFNAAYISARTIESNIGSILDAVRAVNNYVINNTSGTSSSKLKLDNWINVEMNSEWTAECPSGWANLSESAGYDTTDWTVT